MDDFEANYQTRPGVKVMVKPSQTSSIYRVYINPAEFVACTSHELSALFEEIPKPVMVTIPLDGAIALQSTLANEGITSGLLDAAIAQAEREQADGK
jgi:hypothetical protein